MSEHVPKIKRNEDNIFICVTCEKVIPCTDKQSNLIKFLKDDPNTLKEFVESIPNKNYMFCDNCKKKYHIGDIYHEE